MNKKEKIVKSLDELISDLDRDIKEYTVNKNNDCLKRIKKTFRLILLTINPSTPPPPPTTLP